MLRRNDVWRALANSELRHLASELSVEEEKCRQESTRLVDETEQVGWVAYDVMVGWAI